MVASLLACLLAATPVVAADSTPDQKAFRTILSDFNRAWATRDPALFVRHFAEDADFMQAFGRYFPTRAATRDFMGIFFSKQSADFVAREVGVRTKWIAPTIVFLEQELEATGVKNMDGSEQPPRRGQMMLVLENREGSWKVVVYRFLDIHGGPIHKSQGTP